MVGRDHELGMLLDRWQRAKQGEGQTVMLVGEAGIGKSRLVQALIDRADEEPHVRIRYQCSPSHTESPLWPVIRQLRHAAGIEANDPAEGGLKKLEALVAR